MMARTCSICSHPERAAIDAALAAGEANRRIAARFGAAEASIRRHKADHLGELVARAEARRGAALAAAADAHVERDDLRGVNVMGELTRALARVNKLFDACDEWLTDPERPGQYTLDPRADEVTVIYYVMLDGKRVPKKSSLDALLRRAEKAENVVAVERWETRHADPRSLLLQTAGEAREAALAMAGLVKMLADAKRMDDFQAALLAEIAAVEPETARAITDRIRRALLLRGALGGAAAVQR